MTGIQGFLIQRGDVDDANDASARFSRLHGYASPRLHKQSVECRRVVVREKYKPVVLQALPCLIGSRWRHTDRSKIARMRIALGRISARIHATSYRAHSGGDAIWLELDPIGG